MHLCGSKKYYWNHIDIENIGIPVVAIERFTMAWKPYVSYAPMWFKENFRYPAIGDTRSGTHRAG